jgi:SAM-dependent methyltransferase
MMTSIPNKKSEQYPFDPLAATYDHDFTRSAIARYLRDRVQQRLLLHFSAGQHLLEMGCGTGEDALFLAQHDIQVTATDVGSGMLAIAHEKTQHESRVCVLPLDLNALPENSSDFNQSFDGAFANFGVLNCLSEWQSLALWLSQRITSGGVLGFAIMPPFCAWEMLWHSGHGDFKTAFRRWRKMTTFQPTPDATPMQIIYPTVRHITRSFAPHFERIHIMPVGVFLPPSDIYGIIEARPSLLAGLRRLEQIAGQISPLALFADHYWIELRRR